MNTRDPSTSETSKSVGSSRTIETVSTIALTVLFLSLLLVRNDEYPPPWLDEGANVSAAAMLARTGLYALPDSAGPRILDPAIQTGPTVIVPIALGFRAFGVGMPQARLLMIPFALLAYSGVLLLARQITGRSSASIAAALVVLGSFVAFPAAAGNSLAGPTPWSFTFMARQVMGEVPALGFALSALLLWLHEIRRPQPRYYRMILSGLLAGAAMVTKSQLLFLVPACGFVVAVFDLVYYKQSRLLSYLSPGAAAIACVALWYGGQFVALGAETALVHAAQLREGFFSLVFSLNPIHWRTAASSLSQTGFWWWGLPGLVWGAAQARRRTMRSLTHAAGLALPVIGFVWFAVFSAGWQRYAFYPLSLTPIWTTGLLVAVIRKENPARWRRARQGAGLLALGFLLGLNGWRTAAYFAAPLSGYRAVVKYFVNKVPVDALIELAEWELSLEIEQPIHHPPNHVRLAIADFLFSGGPRPVGIYTGKEAGPSYLIIGLYGRLTGIYNDLVSSEALLLESFGDYQLYQVTAAGVE